MNYRKRSGGRQRWKKANTFAHFEIWRNKYWTKNRDDDDDDGGGGGAGIGEKKTHTQRERQWANENGKSRRAHKKKEYWKCSSVKKI